MQFSINIWFLSANLSVYTLSFGNTPATFQGSTIAVTNNGGVLRLNGARVITPDVPFLNGNKLSVVHVIDAVLVPPAPFSLPPTITDIVVDLNSKGRFTFFVQALTEFGTTFTDVLSRYTKAGYTVFAPTDDAFKRLGPGALGYDEEQWRRGGAMWDDEGEEVFATPPSSPAPKPRRVVLSESEEEEENRQPLTPLPAKEKKNAPPTFPGSFRCEEMRLFQTS